MFLGLNTNKYIDTCYKATIMIVTVTFTDYGQLIHTCYSYKNAILFHIMMPKNLICSSPYTWQFRNNGPSRVKTAQVQILWPSFHQHGLEVLPLVGLPSISRGDGTCRAITLDPKNNTVSIDPCMWCIIWPREFSPLQGLSMGGRITQGCVWSFPMHLPHSRMSSGFSLLAVAFVHQQSSW